MSRHSNPISTPEQRQHELLALRYYQHPDIVAARAQVRAFWLEHASPSATMRRCFDWAFEEVMFGATVWALNQDPLYPKVITISRLPHRLAGHDIPGSRWGIDNPDSIYRVIPISHEHRYRIRGRVAKQRLVENYFTLWGPDMQTLGLLDGKELEVDAEGRFEITVDASAAEGRRNHIQAPPGSHEFYIRDVIANWATDRANELTIELLAPEPARPPFSEAENLERIKTYMQRWAESTTRWNRQAMDGPVNAFEFTIDRDSDGALRNQIYIMGYFRLPDANTAMVLDVNLGGADYFIAPITNIWGTSNQITDRTGCLNRHQSHANRDGSYTFVLSLRDPGVHNWLDPSDLAEGILTLRWAEFAGGAPGADLGVRQRLVALDQLQQELSGDHHWLRPGERQQQLAHRAQSYAWRLEE